MDKAAYVRPPREAALELARETDLPAFMRRAAALRDAGFGRPVSYSRKVFIPLTKLCRDVCHYCTFAQPPRPGERAYMTLDEVVEVARRGAEAGCKEALFTLGDKPELRYPQARAELDALGYPTTIAYLAAAARAVFDATGLLPHANPGVVTCDELLALREVCPSQGMMLESVSRRLLEPGRAHHGSPDKDPDARLGTLRMAGELAVPYTSGILIGIGETREERIESLLALRELHDAHGHIQEIIIQNFRAKPDTRMAQAPEPPLADLQWTIACARLIFGPGMAIQAPPNLTPDRFGALIRAGINDWGGVSPVTPDHVNPEAPWPHLERLARETEREGKVLTERLTVYPSYVRQLDTWVAEPLRPAVRQGSDAEGFARESPWSPGDRDAVLPAPLLERIEETTPPAPAATVRALCEKAARGDELEEPEIAKLFCARGGRSRGRGAGGRRAAARGQRRRRHLRRQPQHQLHERLLFPVPVLRLLQRQAEREPAGRPLRPRPRRDRPSQRGGVGARRHGSLHAGRHPPRVHGRHLPGHLPDGQGGVAGDARARLLAAWRSGRARPRSACRWKRSCGN